MVTLRRSVYAVVAAFVSIGLMAACAVCGGAAEMDPEIGLEMDPLEAIQRLQARIEALEDMVADLAAQIRSLRRDAALLAEQDRGEAEGVSGGGRGAEDAESASEQNVLQWKPMADGWEYRNATLIDSASGTAKFVVEVCRPEGLVKIATLTATLYDASQHIVATGTAVVLNMSGGDVRTVEFLLEGDPSSAQAFRLQVNTEM